MSGSGTQSYIELNSKQQLPRLHNNCFKNFAKTQINYYFIKITMIKNIIIPVAAFAVTAVGASAFSGDMLEKFDFDLTNEQMSAIEEVHELRIDGADRDEIRAVLDSVGIDREAMHEMRDAAHEYRNTMRESIREAVESGNYVAFLDAIAGMPLEEVIDSESDFEKVIEAYELREEGDYAGAREIMSELGLERPEGFGNRDGMGKKGGHGGEMGARDGSGTGEKMGNRNGGGFRGNQN